MSKRSKAREIVVQMLYQQDLNPDMSADTVREMIQADLKDETLSRFAWSLFSGVIEVRATLDKQLEATATNWSIQRMAPTDRNVMRLGAYELLHSDTPPRVVIDEALELAKKFGGPNSASFVNGILDRLIPRTNPPTTANGPEQTSVDNNQEPQG